MSNINTTTSEKITARHVLAIAIPMILATISIPFLGLVDTTIAGHLDNANYLSAVEIGDTIFTFIYMLFSFLRLTVTGLTAQANGKQLKEEFFIILTQGLLFSLSLGCLLTLIPDQLLKKLLGLISTETVIQQLTFDYLNIRLLSAPAVLGNLVISAFLLGIKRAKLSMYLLLFINISAIILDVIFTCYLGMGINGLAYAIVIGQYMGFIFGIILILQVLNTRLFEILFNLSNYFEGISKFIRINNNLFIRSGCFIIVYGIFLTTSAKFGAFILAANSILLAFYSFISLGLEGFSNATEVLVGNAVGKNKSYLFYQSIFASLRCAFLGALGITLIYVLGGHFIINLITNIPSVRLLSSQYLIWISILPLICVWCYLLDAIFLGMLRVKAMRNSLVIATFIFFVPIWFITKSLGNNGLWLSLVSFFIARILVLVIDLISKPFANHFVVKEQLDSSG